MPRRFRKLGLRTKFFSLLAGLLAVALMFSSAWTAHMQEEQTVNELRQQGQALSQQMMAMWEFMAANQSRFSTTDYSQVGSYQGIHCAIAGRTIAKLFTLDSDYITRFVNFEPRNREDLPDDFEAAALRAFEADPSLSEYYKIVDYEGEESFRYLAPMFIEKTCLSCHGEPKGELDITGGVKEGLRVGDLGGAVSIVIPMDVYRDAHEQSLVSNVLFMLGILVGCMAVTYLAMSVLVIRPVGAIRGAFGKVGSESLDLSISTLSSSAEIDALASEFNVMSRRLAAAYGSLEHQVAERTRELEDANGKLQGQQLQLEEMNRRLSAVNQQLSDDNRYKSDFLAMISHELRTPLTSILAFSEMLRATDRPLSEEEEDMRQELEANSRVMVMMINDILEMSRMDAGRVELELEPVEMGDVIDLVEPVIKPLAEREGLDFSCDIDADVPLILADFEKIRRAIENLASNACKFTPEGGRVEIQVTYCDEDEVVLIDVSDTGIGIAPEDQQRIFERFGQADTSISRKFNGTGLGLTLAKEYAEMHDGTLTVVSAPGQGSTFTMRLPAVVPSDFE